MTERSKVKGRLRPTTIEFVSRKDTPPTVVTSGVSCRMGVGGRRGRKRRRAAARTIGGYGFLFTPKNMGSPNPYTRVYREIEMAVAGMVEAALRAGEEMVRGFAGGIEGHARTAGASSR